MDHSHSFQSAIFPGCNQCFWEDLLCWRNRVSSLLCAFVHLPLLERAATPPSWMCSTAQCGQQLFCHRGALVSLLLLWGRRHSLLAGDFSTSLCVPVKKPDASPLSPTLRVTAPASNVVDMYSGGTWSLATLSAGRSDLAAASTGSLVIFAGGFE